MARRAGRRLSEEEVVQALAIARRSDSVELKVTVPANDHRATSDALGLDPLLAQIRQVFFFDLPDLALNRAGVVVRARRMQGRPGDTVVKFRPVDPDDLPTHLRSSPNVVVELDAMPGGYVCSAALRARVDPAEIRRVARGKSATRKLFSKEQRTFFEAKAPPGVGLDDLAVLGPIFVLKQTFVPKALDRRLVAELWLYPDGSRILELSTKCTAGEAFQVAAETRAYLGAKSIDLDGRQQTKTKAALTFFSKQLAAAPASSG